MRHLRLFVALLLGATLPVVGQGEVGPLQLVLYDTTPPPMPLPPSNTIGAGPDSAVVVSARILDRLGVWLTEYATVDSLSSRLSWTTSDSTVATVRPRVGAAVIVTGLRAYRECVVACAYSHAGVYLADSVRLTVRPPPTPMHLVIEPSPDWAASPNVDNPIWTLTFASQDTVGFVYATVRDVYGNYVMPSHNAVWFSRDTAVVWVTHGRDSLGEGVLHNTRAGGSAIVGACDSSIQSCDSFVVNAPYPYPGCTLTVAVGHAGPPLDTLRAEVGDSIRLTVLAGTLTEPRIWSTPGELRWVLYPAPDTIRVAIPAPSAAADWLFCPLSQGHATLNVWSEHADCWLNLPVLVTEIAAIGRARDAASGSGPGPLLRIGGLCLTIPAGAVKAEVRGFDLRGRIMWCRTILLGAQPHLLAEAVPGLTVVQMRWLARDGHEVSRQATTLEQAR